MQDLSYEQLVVPTLEISDVRIDGVSRDIQSFYELDYHENSIHIQLTNLSYASLGDNTYEYELNGDGTHQTEKPRTGPSNSTTWRPADTALRPGLTMSMG